MTSPASPGASRTAATAEATATVTVGGVTVTAHRQPSGWWTIPGDPRDCCYPNLIVLQDFIEADPSEFTSMTATNGAGR